jgi:hypothetical protein
MQIPKRHLAPIFCSPAKAAAVCTASFAGSPASNDPHAMHPPRTNPLSRKKILTAEPQKVGRFDKGEGWARILLSCDGFSSDLKFIFLIFAVVLAVFCGASKCAS